MGRGEKVSFTCPSCGKQGEKLKSHLKTNVTGNIYCNRACYNVGKKGRVPYNKGIKTEVEWECVGCGKTLSLPNHIAKKKKYCSSQCFGKSYRGENHPYWNGGNKRRDFNSEEYKSWRRSVLKRDEYLCRVCWEEEGKEVTTNLETHHIYPVSSNPELEFDPENGIALCHPCHKNVTGREQEFVPYFKELVFSDVSGLNRNSLKTYEEYVNLFYRLYTETNATKKEIANFCGCTVETITKYFKGLPNKDLLIGNPKYKEKINYNFESPLCKRCDNKIPYERKKSKFCSSECKSKHSSEIRLGVYKPNSGQFKKGQYIPEEVRQKISSALKEYHRNRKCPQ